MIRQPIVWICVLLWTTCGALAAPETSLRPVLRGDGGGMENVPATSAFRPVARPALVETLLAGQLEQQLQNREIASYRSVLPEIALTPERAFAARPSQPSSRLATGFSRRPFTRPDAVLRKAMAKRQERARGAVCGDPAIQGESVGFVPGRISGCGIENAVQVRSVSGIGLSQQAVMDCGTAQALKLWVDKGMKPAVGEYRGGVKQLRVAAHYACRGRNNQAGARISEHGKGRAIDISGFVMGDGTEITVLKDWNRKNTGAILRAMHKRACGIFGTVLGPQSDRFHQDHFHFDTARYRSGSYCR